MSAPQYLMPQNASLTQYERERQPVLYSGQAAGELLLPYTTEAGDLVLWEIRDNIQGLMLHRGNGELYPERDDSGVTRFFTKPGSFGEMVKIPAEYINRARQVGQFGAPIDLTEEVSRIQIEIAEREINLMEKIRWDLLVTGVSQVADKAGTLHEVARFTPLTYTPGTLWSNHAASTPLQNFRDIRDQNIGYHDTGAGAEAWMNSVTANHLFANTNANDLGGKRTLFGASLTGLVDFNRIFLGENLPQVRLYDGNYINDSGTVTRFIPDGKIVIVFRNGTYGTQVGNLVSTSNEALMGEPGLFAGSGVDPKPPFTPWTARGFNGGARIRYGKQTLVATVL